MLGFDGQNGLALGLGSIPTLGSGGTADVPPEHGPSLLVEAGGYLLQESGGTILLEP